MASTNHVAQDALEVRHLTGTQAQDAQQLFNADGAPLLLDDLGDRLEFELQKYTVANTPGVKVASTNVTAFKST